MALINTLHRFSESLHAVEHFREMWKKTGEDDSARLIHEAEKAVTGNVSGLYLELYTQSNDFKLQPRPTPNVQTDPTQFPPAATHRPTPTALQRDVWSRLQAHLLVLVDRCRRHTLTCFGSLSEIWQRLTKAVLPLRTEF